MQQPVRARPVVVFIAVSWELVDVLPVKHVFPVSSPQLGNEEQVTENPCFCRHFGKGPSRKARTGGLKRAAPSLLLAPNRTRTRPTIYLDTGQKSHVFLRPRDAKTRRVPERQNLQRGKSSFAIVAVR
jgi:hypothetical protein